MAITFVIHEASRTGAPRLGALIARELGRYEPVRVIVMKDGPLTPWLTRTLDGLDLVICEQDLSHTRLPFGERLRIGRELLEDDPADIVYVNSLAASVFAFAGALSNRRTLLHVHEKIGEMRNLLNGDATKLETMRVADAALLAADDIRDDLVEVFGTLPPEVETFGVAVEVEAIRRAAAEPPEAPARNSKGALFKRGGRLVVGMCGSASPRKGVDIFLGVADKLPALDFLWVGPWSLDEAPENIAFRDFARAPANFYVCGAAENPYAYMAMMDVFFLSSREDPNPLVLAEALALNLPILAFSQTTAIADRLGRSAILCHGAANVADAARILAACSPDAVRGSAFRAAGEAFLAEYDLNEKMKKVRGLIARLRGDPEDAELFVVAEMDAAATRFLGEGVVELTFS